MGYVIGYLIGWLIYACIFGLITQHVAESKGYTTGFAWGFWLGLIGLLVVGFRPTIQTSNSSYTPLYGGALQPSINSKAKWTCVCGATNREGLSYCPVCRRTREESKQKQDVKCPHCGAMNNSSRKVCVLCNEPLDGTKRENPTEPTPSTHTESTSSEQSIHLLEELAKLHERGILTDEEFQKKKSDILKSL